MTECSIRGADSRSNKQHYAAKTTSIHTLLSKFTSRSIYRTTCTYHIIQDDDGLDNHSPGQSVNPSIIIIIIIIIVIDIQNYLLVN